MDLFCIQERERLRRNGGSLPEFVGIIRNGLLKRFDKWVAQDRVPNSKRRYPKLFDFGRPKKAATQAIPYTNCKSLTRARHPHVMPR